MRLKRDTLLRAQASLGQEVKVLTDKSRALTGDVSALKTKLDARDCEIRLAIQGKGKGEARFWTCDLTEGYIRINASYRT